MASKTEPQIRGPATAANLATSPGISLHDAASKGLTETVARLLDWDVAVDQTDDKGATALHLAAKEGHVDTIRLLLGRKANVEAAYGLLSSKPVHCWRP